MPSSATSARVIPPEAPTATAPAAPPARTVPAIPENPEPVLSHEETIDVESLATLESRLFRV